VQFYHREAWDNENGRYWKARLSAMTGKLRERSIAGI
jgi:hypothetical protein